MRDEKIYEGSVDMKKDRQVNIVVLDGFAENPGDLSWDDLSSLGQLTVYDRTDGDRIIERIGDAQIIFVNKVPITRQTMVSCPHLKYIGVLATGYNVVDTEAAKELQITVTNIPTYGTAAVDQFAIAMLLEICNRFAHHSDAVRAGRWQTAKDFCFWDYPLIELDGKIMGIIGFGRIGQATANIAQALGMNILVYDLQKNPALEHDRCRYVELDELLQTADVITLHCPLTKDTEGIINKNTIAKMKDNVIILNNSRGPLIVEQDLANALNSGNVYAAAVDVVSTEPIREDNPLLQAKNCFISPHISWAAKESRQRLMDIAVDNLKHYLAGNPTNVVS